MDESEQDSNNEYSLLGSGKVKPYWMKPGYVTKAHCGDAASKAESTRSDDTPSNGGSRKNFQDDNKVCRESSKTSELSSASNRDRSRKTGGPASLRPKESKNVHISRYIIGFKVATAVYNIITNNLHRGRDAARVQLFHDGLYVFSRWKKMLYRC